MATPGPGHLPQVARRGEDLQPHAAGVPGHGAAGQRRRQGPGRQCAGRPPGDRPARGWRHSPPAAHAGRSRSTRTATTRSRTSPSRSSAREPTPSRTPAWRPCARTFVPQTVGALPNVQAGVTGLTAEWKDQKDQLKSKLPLVVALRAPARVRADAGRVPLDRRRDQGDRAEPALGRRRLRRARARLPARHRQGPARLQLHRRDRPRDAAAPVRDPVRALDGLPRLHHQPDPGDVRPRREHGRRDRRTGSSPPPAWSRAQRSSWSPSSRSSRPSRC